MSEIVVSDLDGTLVAEDDSVIEETAASLRADAEAGYEIYIVSGRNIDRLDETRQWLADNDIPVDEIHLSDFPEGPNASREFKLYKAEIILESGDEIVVWWEDDFQTRQDLIDIGIPAENPETLKSVRSRKDINDRVAPAAAQEEAVRGLAWREEFGRGGTAIGVARARDISNGVNLSVDTLRRMVSYFARHEIDQEGTGWSPGEDGYPSAGRIAWALWGGTPGRTWATNLLEEIDSLEESPTSETPSTRSTMSSRSTMQPSHKSVPASFQVKAASSDAPHGEATALVSVFNNVDLVGDRILPGAFTASLKAIKDSGRSIPWVWSHQWSDPNAYIGKVLEATETDKGLLVRASFFNTETAQHIKTLLAEGVVSEFSFAYDVIDQDIADDGVTELKAIHILEAGPTLKGANPDTQLVGVRSLYAARPSKAAPGELSVGDFVSWSDGYGRVEYVMTEGFFGVDNDPLSLEATPDNPLAMVRLYLETADGWDATEDFQGFRFSELTATDEPEMEEEPSGASSVAKSTPLRTAHKVGRTLSTKNEDRIREARSLLEEVLSTIDNSTDTVKTEEPTDSKESEVKVEERGLPGEVALALLELESSED